MTQMEELKGLLRETDEDMRHLRADTNELRGAVRSLTFRYRRSRITMLAIAIGMVMTTIAGASLVYVAARNNSTMNCMKNWGNAVSHRTEVLTKLGQQRQDALDILLVDLQKKDQALTDKDYKNYLKVSAEYRTAAVDNPIPSLPAFNCSFH